MGGVTIHEDTDTFPDGTRYEMVATVVPQGEDYPEGIKYRFQYMDEEGRTTLRFDNFPDHPGVDRHHYHTTDGVHDDIEFTGLQDHVQAFRDAVNELREQ